ncbi:MULTISPECIES: protealysin inhibitor emfourin [unclassified Streptomyces]|uniref:protealysin inhibitor emfourin n=1 Tax=unclassified Streptomyces TaxID=2593676 RepID=UPI00364951E4
MRIQVVRTGGFAGIERRAEVDTSGRPDEDEWRALAALALAPIVPEHAPSGVRDGFSYEITVDGRTVSCHDPHLSDAQRTLISRVLKEGA